MLELDIVVGKYAKQFAPNFTLDECQEYQQEILTMETPELYNFILGTEKNTQIDEKSYLFKIRTNTFDN